MSSGPHMPAMVHFSARVNTQAVTYWDCKNLYTIIDVTITPVIVTPLAQPHKPLVSSIGIYVVHICHKGLFECWKPLKALADVGIPIWINFIFDCFTVSQPRGTTFFNRT